MNPYRTMEELEEPIKNKSLEKAISKGQAKLQKRLANEQKRTETWIKDFIFDSITKQTAEGIKEIYIPVSSIPNSYKTFSSNRVQMLLTNDQRKEIVSNYLKTIAGLNVDDTNSTIKITW